MLFKFKTKEINKTRIRTTTKETRLEINLVRLIVICIALRKVIECFLQWQ